jgi:hypothetical protein
MQNLIERAFEAVRSGDEQSLRELLTLDPKLAGAHQGDCAILGNLA